MPEITLSLASGTYFLTSAAQLSASFTSAWRAHESSLVYQNPWGSARPSCGSRVGRFVGVQCVGRRCSERFIRGDQGLPGFSVLQERNQAWRRKNRDWPFVSAVSKKRFKRYPFG